MDGEDNYPREENQYKNKNNDKNEKWENALEKQGEDDDLMIIEPKGKSEGGKNSAQRLGGPSVGSGGENKEPKGPEET